MPDFPKSYLGDGVYAAIENGMIKLTVENGIAVQNKIYLEHEVFEALCKYVKRIDHIAHEAAEYRAAELGEPK